MAVGATFVRADRTPHGGRRQVHFVFEIRGAVDELRAAWVNETAEVNAVDFKDAILKLKSLVHTLE